MVVAPVSRGWLLAMFADIFRTNVRALRWFRRFRHYGPALVVPRTPRSD